MTPQCRHQVRSYEWQQWMGRTGKSLVKKEKEEKYKDEKTFGKGESREWGEWQKMFGPSSGIICDKRK